MIKRLTAVAILLAFLNAQEAHAFDKAAFKLKVEKIATFPVYVGVGLVAGPVLGVLGWRAYYKGREDGLKVLQKLKADTVKPTEQKEALKSVAK